MSIKDETPALEHGANGSALVTQRGVSLAPADIEWPAAAVGQPSGTADAFAYLHAARRHWLLGLMLGAVCASLLGGTAWFFLPRTYTATGAIRITMQRDDPSGKRQIRINPQEFQSDKNTQMVLLKGHNVLTAALRSDKVKTLPMVVAERPNEVKWLSGKLAVAFPDDSEIMTVSLKGDDPAQVTEIVNAVIQAYKTLVVDAEENERRGKLVEMRRIMDKKATALRAQEAHVRMLIENNNTADPEELRAKRAIEGQKLTDFRRELWKAQFDIQGLEGQKRIAENSLKRLNANEQGLVTDLELEQLKQSNFELRDLERQLASLGPMIQRQGDLLRPSADMTVFRGSSQPYFESVKAQYDAKVAELLAVVKRSKQQELEIAVSDLNSQLEVLAVSRKSLEKLVQEQEAFIAQLGKSTVEAIMAQHDLEVKKAALDQVALTVEQLEVEQYSRPRISIQQEAPKPEVYDGPELRLALTALICLVGLALPLAALVLVDVSKRRINSSADVVKGLGLPVIGSVPLIPTRALRHLNSNDKADQQWSVRLAESIDGITARLLRNATIDGCRVVLITSAVSGEGKTTLATQVATSLARAGRRTVLVDFDLRRPAIDRAFGLPLEPGVSDALCGQAEVENLPNETAAKNLFVVTAGRCDRHALQALANGADERLFDELRSEFEFVIVDGSPILPVADSRYVSQHVDTVLLSIFRDFSRAPKVTAACEILESFGVTDIEAVVTSTSEDTYGTLDIMTA